MGDALAKLGILAGMAPLDGMSEAYESWSWYNFDCAVFLVFMDSETDIEMLGRHVTPGTREWFLEADDSWSLIQGDYDKLVDSIYSGTKTDLEIAERHVRLDPLSIGAHEDDGFTCGPFADTGKQE